MARQVNTKLTGTKGNLSFYKMDGEYYVRLKSSGGKQTPRTKARQKDFAIAASLSRKIRIMLHTAIPDPKQKAMQNRLTKALLQWQFANTAQETGTTIEQLHNFQFTEAVSLKTVFNVNLTINKTAGGLQVIIPPFKPKASIKAPVQTKQIHMNIVAGRCSITRPGHIQRIHTQRLITCNNKRNEQQIIEMRLKPLEQSVTVIAISLTYWVQQNDATLLQVKQNGFTPAAIIYAVADGTMPGLVATGR